MTLELLECHVQRPYLPVPMFRKNVFSLVGRDIEEVGKATMIITPQKNIREIKFTIEEYIFLKYLAIVEQF